MSVYVKEWTRWINDAVIPCTVGWCGGVDVEVIIVGDDDGNIWVETNDIWDYLEWDQRELIVSCQFCLKAESGPGWDAG